jgi:hypothetical protein
MMVALERELTQDRELHCMGGFVLAEYYELVRATGDVDVLESAGTDKATIARLGGRDSPRHKRHRVYIGIVTVADVPDDYGTRLVAMDIEGLTRRRLKVFERHDLVLAKLCATSIVIARTLWRLPVAHYLLSRSVFGPPRWRKVRADRRRQRAWRFEWGGQVRSRHLSPA